MVTYVSKILIAITSLRHLTSAMAAIFFFFYYSIPCQCLQRETAGQAYRGKEGSTGSEKDLDLL